MKSEQNLHSFKLKELKESKLVTGAISMKQAPFISPLKGFSLTERVQIRNLGQMFST